MRFIVIAFVLVVNLFSSSAYAQTVYFGYPDCQNNDSLRTLRKGDMVILNFPEFYDHLKFVNSNGISKLCQFLDLHSDINFLIEIHVFLEDEEFNQRVSERLKESLEKLLINECRKKNYTILPKGSTEPLHLITDSPLYRMLNSRMQVIAK